MQIKHDDFYNGNQFILQAASENAYNCFSSFLGWFAVHVDSMSELLPIWKHFPCHLLPPPFPICIICKHVSITFCCQRLKMFPRKSFLTLKVAVGSLKKSFETAYYYILTVHSYFFCFSLSSPGFCNNLKPINTIVKTLSYWVCLAIFPLEQLQRVIIYVLYIHNFMF